MTEVATSSATATPSTKDATEEVPKEVGLLANGKRNLLCGEITTAVNQLQEACRLLAAKYGDLDDRCGEAYLCYGSALLDLSRMESGVLGNALQGIEGEAEESEEGSSTKDDKVEDPEACTGEEREKVSNEVIDAMLETDEELAARQKKEKANENDTAKDEKKDEKEENKDEANKEQDMETGDDKEKVDEEKSKSDEKKDEDKAEKEKDKKAEDEAEKSKKAENEAVKDKTAEEGKGKDKTAEEGKGKDKTAEEKKEKDKTAEEKKEKDKTAEEKKEKDKTAEEKKEKDKTAEEKKEKDKTAEEEKEKVKSAEKDGKEARKEEKVEKSDSKDEEKVEEKKAEKGQEEAMETDVKDSEEKAEGEESEDGEGDTAEEDDTADGDTAEDEAKGEEKKDEEDVSNLQLAWEILELAKVIYSKHDSKEMKLKAAEAYLKLGEVGLETEQYEQAIGDLRECLKLQQDHLEPESRLIAETHYQIGLACSFSSHHDDALKEFRLAVKTIETKIAKLTTVIEAADAKGKGKEPASFDDPVVQAQKEVKDLKEILPDILAKIEDTEDEKRNQDRVKELVKENLACDIGTTTFGEKKSEKPSETKEIDTKDITHMVRKKRKPESESETEDSKKAKTENGSGDAPTEINGKKENVTNGTEAPSVKA